MTTCLGKSCSFGLQCVSFVNVYQFCVCVLLSPFGFEGVIWDWIVFIPGHCLSIYFVFSKNLDRLFGCVCAPDESTLLLRKRICRITEYHEPVDSITFN